MTELPLNQILQGDCRKILKSFPKESVDLVMFSPPYYGLRDYGEATVTIWGGDEKCEHEWVEHIKPKERGSYGESSWHRPSRDHEAKWNPQTSHFCKKCGAWRGQLGLEPHWRMYVEHIVEVCREIKRVLKRTGSMYIVIGDTYASALGKHGNRTAGFSEKKMVTDDLKPPKPKDYKEKCLMGIPWRVAFALIEDGWILRNDIIWYKRNHMPSSVKDRLTQTYEHIFHFVKHRKYYYCLDTIREPHKEGVVRWGGSIVKVPKKHKVSQGLAEVLTVEDRPWRNPKGKNPGDLWNIPTRPFKGAHFAVYPLAICVRPILSSCPPDGVVLDPMAGSGTTCLAAQLINLQHWDLLDYEPNEVAKSTNWCLKWIGIEINPNYVEIAKNRLEPFLIKKLEDFEVLK